MNHTFKTPLVEGSFTVGANYWASHAGTNMWREWNEEVIDDDLRRLSESGIRLLRIFPLWPDFQPLKMVYGSRNEVYYENDEFLPFTAEGRAGVDPVMMERFERFCRIAEKYEIKLIIALITGWMSGRRYIPKLMEELDVLTDPCAIKWEIRFVQYMVKRFLKEETIIAWELGNECNTLGAKTQDEAYVWAKTITMAVKEIDSERPMISGMHGMSPERKFTAEMLGEIDDFLTTHPYPLFTEYCNTDPMTKMKSALHAAAESVLYADLSGKPCFVEEAGSLAPMMANNDNVAHYVTASAMTAWAYNLRAYLWWCANEQLNLKHAPYDWCDVERELGLFDNDKKPKPVLHAMTALQEYADHFPCELKKPVTDAVCILTRGQKQWAVAYGTFLLAKQAGLDIRFCYCDDEMPEADVYLMPSIEGLTSIARHAMEDILACVEKGAALYLSIGDALMSPFEQFSGVRPNYRMQQPHTDNVYFVQDENKKHALKLNAPITLDLSVVSAKVIAQTEDGKPALTCNEYGEGVIWYCNYPIEYYTGVTPKATEEPLYMLYEAMKFRNTARVAAKSDPLVGLTEHIVDEHKRVLVVINYEPQSKDVVITLEEGWTVAEFVPLEDSKIVALEESGVRVHVQRNSGVSLIITK